MNPPASRRSTRYALRFIASVIFILTALMMISASSVGQWNSGGEIDKQPISFGFQLGLNANTFTIDKIAGFQEVKIQSVGRSGTVSSGRLKYINSNFTSGFHLGLLANFRITDNLDIRFTPDVNFSDRTLAFAYDSILTSNGLTYSNPILKTVQSTYVDFPLLLKFKSDRKGNIRAYIIGGLQYSFDIIPKKKTDDTGLDPVEKLVKLQTGSLSYKLGIGLDLYYEYFKMSPELSVSNGLNNILKQDNSPFSSPIQRLFPTSVQFTLYFE